MGEKVKCSPLTSSFDGKLYITAENLDKRRRGVIKYWFLWLDNGVDGPVAGVSENAGCDDGGRNQPARFSKRKPPYEYRIL